MSDMTRAEAIDELCRLASDLPIMLIDTVPKHQKDRFVRALKVGINSLQIDEQYDLMYEQAEPTGDLISRQAVIDTIHRFFTEEVDKIPTKKTEDGEVYVIHKCQPLFEMNKAICKRIKALPSASPTQNCVENALGALGCISRQAVEEIINDIRDCISVEGYWAILERLKKLPSVNPQEPKTGHCKDCKYFEYDSVAKIDGIPLIIAHEICTKWGDGCKTKEDGYCFLFEPQESEEV